MGSGPTTGTPEEAEVESWNERFLGALPLFVVGGACTASAVFLYISGVATTVGGNGSVHLRPWVLFLALAITGLSAGTIALFADGEAEAPGLPSSPSPPAAPTASPLPKRSAAFGRPALRPRESSAGESGGAAGAAYVATPAPAGTPAARATPAAHRSPMSARVWDESELPAGTPTAFARESWDESTEELEATASAPAPPDVVLRQVDELEASLRKKPASHGAQ